MSADKSETEIGGPEAPDRRRGVHPRPETDISPIIIILSIRADNDRPSINLHSGINIIMRTYLTSNINGMRPVASRRGIRGRLAYGRAVRNCEVIIGMR